MRARCATRSRQAGGSIIEFALIATTFLTITLGILELGLMFFVNITMQHAVREGVRYAVTGQSGLDPDTSNQQRYHAVIQATKNASMGYFDQVSPVIVVSVNDASPTSYAGSGAYTSGMFGGPGDILVLRIDCTWPLITPLWQSFFKDGKYAFSVAATMRNEGYK